MNKHLLLFLAVLVAFLPQHSYSAKLIPISGPGSLTSLDVSPDGRTIVAIENASVREDGQSAKSKVFIWDAECLLHNGDDCQKVQSLPWFDSSFLYWRDNVDQFVVDSLTLQQIDAVAPFAQQDLKSFAIVKWPKVMRSDAPAPAPSSEAEVVEGAVRYLSSDGRVALRLVDRDQELRVVTPSAEMVIPRRLYDLRTLMPNRYEITVSGHGSGFYFWSGSMGARGELLKYTGRKRSLIPLPTDVEGSLEIVFPPNAMAAVAAFTPDAVRGVEYRGPLVALVNEHVQTVRLARPDLELKAVRVSDDYLTWALLFASIGGAQELHVLKPGTGAIGTVRLSDGAAPDRLSSHYISVPEGQRTLPARYYARRGQSRSNKLIVRFHGGPPVSAADDVFGWVRRLSAQGFDVLDVDYRGSPGYGAKHFLGLKRPAAKVLKKDLGAAVAWARHHGYTQIGFLGTSAGGLAGAAALADSDLKLDFMVLESPLIDQPKGLAGISCSRIKGQTTDRVFGLRRLPDGQCEPYPTGLLNNTHFASTPVLLIAGKRDLRTPFAIAEAWAGRVNAGGGCVEVVASEQGRHTLYDWPKPEERRALLMLESWLTRVEGREECHSRGPGNVDSDGVSREPVRPNP